MKNETEIRYKVGPETTERIKKLAEIWQVSKGVAVEIAVNNAFENLEINGPLMRAMLRIEEKLDMLFEE